MQSIRPVAVRFTAVLAVFTAVTALTYQPARAQAPAVLAQAPQGAQLVLIVPSMSQFSGKLSMLNQALGLEADELTDALGAFKAEIGIADGLNDIGSAMIIVPDLSQVFAGQPGGETAILIILPVTDYQAFIGNFQGETPAAAVDGVTALVMPDGQAAYVRESGGYAIMGNQQEVIAGYTPSGDANAIASRIGELGRHYLNNCDVAVYLDLEAIAPMLLEKFDEIMAPLTAGMDQAAESGMMVGPDMEMVKSIITLYASAGKAVLNSSQGMLVSLDINKQGIGATYAVQFKPGSPIMKYLPGGAGRTAALLARLPKDGYLFAGAFDAQAIALGDLFENALAQMPEGTPQVDLYRKALPMIKQIKQYAGVFYTPDPAALMGGGSALNMLQTYDVQDTAEYVKQMKQYITDLNGTAIPMAMPMGAQGQSPKMTYVTSYTDNALQLDGVQVDQYSMQVQMPQEMMMMMGPMAGFMQMFTNFNGYTAASDGHVLMTTTLDQQLITKGLKTGKTGDGIGTADSIAAIREQAIPPNPVGEFYISLGGITETISPFMMMFGMPQIEAPQDLPPIAMGLGLKDNSAAARLYIPNQTTKFVVDTVKDIQAQMMGGPDGPDDQPQGPGAPPPPF